MDYITDWAGRIAAYLIFATVISNLLQKKSYLKYVRLIIGTILIIILSNPILSLLSQKENYSFHLNRYLLTAKSMDHSFIYEMKGIQDELTLQKLEEQLNDRIRLIVMNNDLVPMNTDISFSEDSMSYAEPSGIHLVVSTSDTNSEWFETDIPAVIRIREKLSEEFGIKKENIIIEVVVD